MVEGGETTPKNLLMETTHAIEGDWPFLLTLLPEDLDASAKEMGALGMLGYGIKKRYLFYSAEH